MPCSEACLQCNSDTDCTLCSTDTVLYERNCIIKCPDIFYKLEGKCEKCQENCISCMNSTQCEKCEENYFLYQKANCVSACSSPFWGDVISNTCVPDCLYAHQYGDINDFRKCHECDKSCAICIENAYKCTSCYDKLYLSNSICYETCPLGTYAVDKNKRCKIN